MIITESFLTAATVTDLLEAPSRLAAIPEAGIMTLQISATQCTATNTSKVTIQLPDGSNPVKEFHIPFNGYSATDGVMHDETALQIQFPVDKGGHVLISITETGTVAFVMAICALEF